MTNPQGGIILRTLKEGAPIKEYGATRVYLQSAVFGK